METSKLLVNNKTLIYRGVNSQPLAIGKSVAWHKSVISLHILIRHISQAHDLVSRNSLLNDQHLGRIHQGVTLGECTNILLVGYELSQNGRRQAAMGYNLAKARETSSAPKTHISSWKRRIMHCAMVASCCWKSTLFNAPSARVRSTQPGSKPPRESSQVRNIWPWWKNSGTQSPWVRSSASMSEMLKPESLAVLSNLSSRKSRGNT